MAAQITTGYGCMILCTQKALRKYFSKIFYMGDIRSAPPLPSIVNVSVSLA
jgi:hypothetical protein